MYHLLRRLLPQKKTEVEELRELESRLLPGEGKLIFSKKEVAKEPADFCRDFMTKPLQKRPSEGSRQRGSLEVLQHQRTRAPLKVRRESGAERMYEEDKKTAKELLIWLTKIKAESVLKDLDDTRLKRTSMRRNIRATPGSFPAATWR